MHQVGIENVVASSGTSLTVEQIRLIGRYTKNITVLYDGDPAGIKASLRGIDLILEEGLNVRVVLFPDGDDPDSFSRKHTSYEVAAYISENAQDFIKFKTGLLLKEVANDPVRKAGLIREIVETIARIPDPIIRSTYTKECSVQMDISENILLSELNKILRRTYTRQQSEPEIDDLLTDIILPREPVADENVSEYQEADIIRLLLTYGEHDIYFDEPVNERETRTVAESVKSFIVHEISQDEIIFENPVYLKIFNHFEKMVHTGVVYNSSFFVNHEEEDIRKTAADFLTLKYPLAQWIEKGVAVKEELEKLKHAVLSAVYSLKIKHVAKLMKKNVDAIRDATMNDIDTDELQREWMQLDEIKQQLSRYLSIVVLK
jgi:DNA primase